MTDDKDELIQEMSERIKTLEKKEDNRVSTPWGVYDQGTFNTLFWIGMGFFGLAIAFVIYVVMGGNLLPEP
jgi:hypothetical protein